MEWSAMIKAMKSGDKEAVSYALHSSVAIYEVIKDNKVFKPTDYEEVTNPAPKKTKELTADQAISVLKNLGYDVTQLKIPETEQSIQSSKSAVSTAA